MVDASRDEDDPRPVVVARPRGEMLWGMNDVLDAVDDDGPGSTNVEQPLDA